MVAGNEALAAVGVAGKVVAAVANTMVAVVSTGYGGYPPSKLSSCGGGKSGGCGTSDKNDNSGGASFGLSFFML